jgi:DNA-binding NarL/FixJ family response regulator
MPESLDYNRRHPIKQLEVLVYAAHGLTQHEIARKLGLNRTSVHDRLHSAYRHLGITPQEALEVFERVRDEIVTKEVE